MHAGAQGHVYHEFIEEIQGDFPSIQMTAPDNGGDYFTYKRGKISSPKGMIVCRASSD